MARRKTDAELLALIQAAGGKSLVALGEMFRAAGVPSAITDGAWADGVHDDTAVIQALEALAPVALPRGLYKTTINQSLLRGRFMGPGQVITSDGNHRAPEFSAMEAPPASFGNVSSVLTFFNGDLSKVIRAAELRVTGATTLGNPATGYLIRPENAGDVIYAFMQNTGHNESLVGNDGRTGCAARATWLYQAGQGDLYANYVNGFIAAQKAGATHFLAQPAGVIIAGGLSAGMDYVFLNVLEFNLTDNGFDVAGIGPVVNLMRTNALNGQGVVWNGIRIQSKGSQAIDGAYFASGPMLSVLDAWAATATSVVSRQADQWNYFNVTPDPDPFKKRPTFTGYREGFDSSTQTWNVEINGNRTLKVGDGTLDINATVIRQNGVPVTFGGGGGATVTELTVNFSSPTAAKFFDIAYAGAVVGQKVMATPSLKMPVGVAEDELEMDPITVAGYVKTAGQVRLLVSSVSGSPLGGQRIINVQVV